MKCANKALSSVQTKFILLIGVWRKYHDLMLQNNKTRGREVRETYLRSVSTARSKTKTNDSLYWLRLFQTRRSDIHVGWIIIVASGSNWKTGIKRNGEVVSPYPSPPLPTPAPLAVFPAHFSLYISWEQRPFDPLPIIVEAPLSWELMWV